MSLIIASGANNLILTSSNGGVTWLTRHADDASTNLLTIGAWDGNQTYVLCGGDNAPADGLWASTNGGMTWAKITIPAGMGFGVAANIGQLTDILRTLIWDGKQFVCVGWVQTSGDYAQGKVGTSPDGVTWTFANLGSAGSGSHTGHFIGIASNGSRYIALEWNVGLVGPDPDGNQPSAIYTSTDLLSWSLVFTSAAESEYAWIGANPQGGFLILATDSLATAVPNTATAYAASSPDGITWRETPAGISIGFERRQVMWDTLTNQWIATGFDNSFDPALSGTNKTVIRTSSDGFTWTTRLDLGFSAIVSQFCGTVLRGSNGNLYAWLSAGTGSNSDPPYPGNGQPFVSTDGGNTWSAVTAPIKDVQPGHLAWNGSAFVSLNLAVAPDFDTDPFLSTSPDAINWTNHFDDTLFDLITLQQFGVAGQGGLPEGPPAGPASPEVGQLIGLTYEVEQQVWGWHRHFTGQDQQTPDNFVSVCALQDPTNEQNDNLWAVTERMVNGQPVYFVEFFDPTLNTDAATETEFTSRVTSVSGLAYLAGRTVQVKADGSYLGTFVVPQSGVIDFSKVLPTGAFDVEIGLPYTSVALTVRPEIGQGGQTIQGLKKQWNRVFARVYKAINILIGAGGTSGGGNTDAPPAKPWRLLGRRATDPLGVAPAPFTGDVPLEGSLGADYDGRVLIEQDQPFPITVLAPFGIFTIGEQ